jgi:lysyl-tRNA synthetase class 2
MEDLSQVLRVRREKLDALREQNIEPFAYNFSPSHASAALVTEFEAAEEAEALTEDGDGPRASIGGRIVGWRGHGKSAFAHIEDGHGRVQVYFKKNVIGDERFEELDLIDLGDWVGVDPR